MKNKHFFISVCCLVLAGCVTTPQVFTDFDARRDFTQYETFSWLHEPPMLSAGDYPISALAESRMTNAIKQALIDKGYEFVEAPAEADFTAVYTMGARDSIQVDLIPDTPYYRTRVYWGWGGHYYPHYRHYPFHVSNSVLFRTAPRLYTEGDIAIDIFDGKSQEPVWHARASRRLTSSDIQSNANNAADVATKLLAEFPLKGLAPLRDGEP